MLVSGRGAACTLWSTGLWAIIVMLFVMEKNRSELLKVINGKYFQSTIAFGPSQWFWSEEQHFVFGFDLVVLSRFAIHWSTGLSSSTKNRTWDIQVVSADGPLQVNSCLAQAFNVKLLEDRLNHLPISVIKACGIKLHLIGTCSDFFSCSLVEGRVQAGAGNKGCQVGMQCQLWLLRRRHSH